MNDKREGWGTFSWTDGRKYVGEWRAGKQHGKGTYISCDGTSKAGLWEAGKKIRWTENED